MPFRVSIFFTQQQDLLGGWSENFWNSKTDLAAARTAGNALALALNGFHGNQTQLIAMRISDPASFRAVDITRYALAVQPPSRGDFGSDFVTTAGLLVLGANPNYITRQWLRGIPDGDIAFGGRWSPLPTSVTAFGGVRTLLTNTSNGWVLKKQNRDTLKKVIQAVTQAGVVTCTGHGLASNDRTRISRAKGTFIINRVWQVTVIDPNTFQLIGFVQPAVPAVYLGNGTSQAQIPIYPAIGSADISRATSHRTGRPFGQLSGRRRVRRT